MPQMLQNNGKRRRSSSNEEASDTHQQKKRPAAPTDEDIANLGILFTPMQIDEGQTGEEVSEEDEVKPSTSAWLRESEKRKAEAKKGQPATSEESNPTVENPPTHSLPMVKQQSSLGAQSHNGCTWECKGVTYRFDCSKKPRSVSMDEWNKFMEEVFRAVVLQLPLPTPSWKQQDSPSDSDE
ncbi:hypothetical protein Ocin01_11374 [Orchesella cincta]|uniref:Uncharacterized protein n=1 Tax=Orchesella cincta TaxID=48709 RepID=A0A1D2MR70_ORCCI|nr:hypothetical protein Ocin01_11374 [Orchesella cincta]